jgi:hypothetical protein
MFARMSWEIANAVGPFGILTYLGVCLITMFILIKLYKIKY